MTSAPAAHLERPYPALSSAEEGINRFLALETCLGVRPQQYYAPYGFTGLYAGILTPNPATPYPELFASKAASYKARWHWLTVAHVRADRAAIGRTIEERLSDFRDNVLEKVMR